MRSIHQYFAIVFLWCTVSAFSQIQYSWSELPNAPIAASRHDDTWFVNERIGWVVNIRGEIYKTIDGGNSWVNQLVQPETDFRSCTFIDSMKGFVGNLGTEEYGGGTDTTILYRTLNGGETFEPVENIIGQKPRGVCGMFAVNDSVIYASGRVRGPAFIMKSTDGGETWYSTAMDSLAAGLIDCYFVSPDTGFTVGLSNSLHGNSSGVILSTVDGGQTWQKVHTTSRTGEWCWKISFPSRKVGYVSLQRNSLSPIYFLKTTDGGVTWEEKLFRNEYYYVQGIGFVNENVGWIGGNNTHPTYKTTDGGETWTNAGFGNRLNRFRFVNDTLGYGVGVTVYKLKAESTVGIATDEPIAESVRLYQNYPNPFNPTTTIDFELAKADNITIKIFDVNGSEIATLFEGMSEPGYHSVNFDAGDLPSGVYFYQLQSATINRTGKMVLMK